MTLFHNRRPFDRNRQGRRRSFPYVRQSRVHAPTQFWHHGPRIKLEGEWLKEAGFFSNWHIKVTVFENKLIIEPLIKPYGACIAAPASCRSTQLSFIATRSA